MKIRFALALIILVIGAFLPMSPASTWSAGEQIAGAPPTQPGPDELVDARRAAGEAGAQVGFFTQGTSQLKDGTEQLRDGVQTLADGTDTAQSGATELSNGMNALSGGLAELGSGANQIADGVESAVNTVVTFEAVKGQVIVAIDEALKSTEGTKDPEVKKARDTLSNLRGQVEMAKLPQDMETQLTQLRDGSREIANQLGTPGYAFYDGVYAATTGSMDLASGLTELRDGTFTARDGAQELYDGAVQVDTMADNTGNKIDAVQRAIPAPTPTAASDSANASAPTSALSPLVALLIGALMVLGGVAVALAAFVAPHRKWSIVGFGTAFLAVIGLILVMVLGVGLSPVAMLLLTLALALGAIASTGLTWILLCAFGLRAGAIISAAFTAVQVGVVGWVWRTAAVGPVAMVWEKIASALPLHWTTTALSAAGNGGSTQAMWIGIVLSAVLALVGVVALWRGAPQEKLATKDEFAVVA
ncbi:hypothetical protein ACXZ66_01720 [Corynebacterium sp. S7]